MKRCQSYFKKTYERHKNLFDICKKKENYNEDDISDIITWAKE